MMRWISPYLPEGFPGLILAVLLVAGQPARAWTQVAPEFGTDFVFNHTDFMFGFLGGAAFEEIDLSARANIMVRPGTRRVLIEAEMPNVYYQYREQRCMLGVEVEKRFTLTEFNSDARLGAWLAAWGGFSLANYRGTSAKAPDGLNYILRGGAFFNQEVMVLQLGYAFMPLRTNNIVPHRVFIGLHFIINE